MASFHHHRRLTSQIRELADALTVETEAFHSAATARANASCAVQTLKSSTDWLQRASQAMLLGIAALRDARGELDTADD